MTDWDSLRRSDGLARRWLLPDVLPEHEKRGTPSLEFRVLMLWSDGDRTPDLLLAKTERGVVCGTICQDYCACIGLCDAIFFTRCRTEMD